MITNPTNWTQALHSVNMAPTHFVDACPGPQQSVVSTRVQVSGISYRWRSGVESQLIFKSCCFHLWSIISYYFISITISIVKANITSTNGISPNQILDVYMYLLLHTLAEVIYIKKYKLHHMFFVVSLPLLKTFQWLCSNFRPKTNVSNLSYTFLCDLTVIQGSL